MSLQHRRPAHVCPCPVCSREPDSELAEEHRTINRLIALFDEKRRRRFVGFLAQQRGRGGIEQLARITGLSPKTIRRGMRELQPPGLDPPHRVRRAGGGANASKTRTLPSSRRWRSCCKT